MSWTTFLETAPPAEHAVQCYRELDELAASVADSSLKAFAPATLRW